MIMSDIMTSIPFGNLMDWVMKEHQQGAVFGVRRPFIADMDRSYEIFGRKLETPFARPPGRILSWLRTLPLPMRQEAVFSN